MTVGNHWSHPQKADCMSELPTTLRESRRQNPRASGSPCPNFPSKEHGTGKMLQYCLHIIFRNKPRQSVSKNHRFTSRIERAKVLEYVQISEPGEGKGARESSWVYVFRTENSNSAYLNQKSVYTITTGKIKIFCTGYT